MAKNTVTNEAISHKHFSTKFFNQAWELIDKPERTLDEDFFMVHLTHASLSHWLMRDDCTDENLSTAYWQLSRVYSLIDEPEQALKYALRCLNFSERRDIGQFFLGYAYEALARAYMLLENSDKKKECLEKAKAITSLISPEDARSLRDDLASIV
jgi:tetratricopeptide (TPR) repeat protein